MSEMFPNRMDPDRARAASERVIRKLRQRLTDLATDPRGQAMPGGQVGGPSEGTAERVNSLDSAGSLPPPTPRIRIDVPLGTSYQEIKELILRQAYEHAGTQLLAAKALGITPDTVSRILRRQDRRKLAHLQVPEVWPAVTTVNRLIGSSDRRTIDGGDQTPEQATAHGRKVGGPRERNDAATPYPYADAAMDRLIDEAIDRGPV